MIDADALIERIGDWIPHDKCGEEDIDDVIYAEACIDLIDVIKDAPTVEQSRWVPCSEKLPKNHERVLLYVDPTYTGDGWVDIAYMCYGVKSAEYYFENNTKEYAVDEVLAWMPLPDAYERE